MAKKKQTAAAERGRGRGGRKPGSWTLVNPEVLRGWREKHEMSRAHVESTLGVRSTSIQNWETGLAVATTKMQQKLADLMKAAPTTTGPAPTERSPGPTNGAAPSHDHPTLIQATAAIVVEAIRVGGGKNVSAKELGALVRTVRDALA